MKFFVLYAHPDPNSLNASLHRDTVQILKDLGHDVTVSDLYDMKWKSVADYDDLGDLPETENYTDDSGIATRNKTLSPDILAEQAKIASADAVIVQFPLWWFSMPAIMKGWFDRVFTNGFGYGTTRDWPRYGNGVLQGKRVLTMVTMGAGAASVSERGVSGDIHEALFFIQHGILHYAGMEPLDPFLVYSAFRVEPEKYAGLRDELRERLSNWNEEKPIGFRRQGGGDYDEKLLLKPGREAPGVTNGYKLHIA